LTQQPTTWQQVPLPLKVWLCHSLPADAWLPSELLLLLLLLRVAPAIIQQLIQLKHGGSCIACRWISRRHQAIAGSHPPP
jgi:hypothetical protein